MTVAWSASSDLDGLVKNALDELSNQEFIRNQERGRDLRNKMEPRSDIYLDSEIDANSGKIPNGEHPCFIIDRIELEGTGAKFFQWALAAANEKQDSPINRCLGVNGINLVISRVQNALVSHGYITSRVFIGQQNLRSGTLTLTIMSGTIAEIKAVDEEQSFIVFGNAIPTASNKILNLRDIEQALENLKRVPTADADIAITPSANGRPGASDLLVSYHQGFPLRFSMSVDDAGSKGTGVYQGSVTVSVDNPLRLSDLFYVSFNHDLGGGDAGRRGSESKSFHYSLPFRYWLMSVTANASDYYQSVAGLTETYIYSGQNEQVDLALSRVVWRNAQSKLLLQTQLTHKKSWNYIDDTEVKVQRRAITSWKAGVNYRTRFGQSSWDNTLAYRRGVGAFGAMRAPEEAYGEGTSRFQIWTADSYFSMPVMLLGANLRYSATGRMQLNQTKLLPQERFSIGGRYTVRGFDGASSLMGERGVLLRNDLGWKLPIRHYTEPYIGLDFGRVGGPTSQSLAGQTLIGTALGLKGQWQGFYYDAFYGWSLHQPSRFTSSNTFGFSVNYSF